MNSYIGIDLGTSAVKLLLIAVDGSILAEQSENYDISYPNLGWSEQNPEDWWKAVKTGLKKLLVNQDKKSIKAISFGGQMHGLVILDKDYKVIRPCILWNDSRAQQQTNYLNEVIGKEKLSSYTANVAFAGFTAPKILWLKENEPENFRKVAKIMLPKDYIAYMLSGIYSTDYSDASGTLLLDVKNKRWSSEMLQICDISENQLPKLYESFEVTGNILPAIAAEMRLNNDIKIIAGASDNAAAAVATGTVEDSACNISLGTSGTIFISCDNFLLDKQNALHSFCHADSRFHIMGCILSAASCNEWWMNILQAKDYDAEQMVLKDKLGKNTVFFLPYLMGERSPHNDVNATGAFIGLNMKTDRSDMTLAIFEGVAFAIRDCLEVVKKSGAVITMSKICGGGAKSMLWKKIMANVLNIEIQTIETEQGPGYGAAILAMVGNNEYESVRDAVKHIVRTKRVIKPCKEIAYSYNVMYNSFKKLYPTLKEVFTEKTVQ